MLKDLTKQAVARIFSKFDYPLFVNSYGRSGSTVLTKSIVKGAITATNGIIGDVAYRSIAQSAWDLEGTELKNGIVYKTHDYPPEACINSNVRILYTFADPVDVVLSLLRLFDERGEEWIKEHYKHLRVPYDNFRDIVHEDQLQLQDHLNSWLNESRYPIAFIKYEAMWDHQDDISNFLGFDIQLPPFKKRKAKKDQELASKIAKTYAPLKRKIGELDSFFISG